MRIEIANNLAQFSAVADDWDKMWDFSQASLPTLKSMLLISAVKHFYQPADFSAILVYENDQLIANVKFAPAGLDEFADKVADMEVALQEKCHLIKSSRAIIS